MKKTDLLKQIEQSGVITEQQILLLKNRMNRGEKMDLDFIWNGEIKLTQDQNNKGINFLRNLYQTPKGIERKNSPFGFREIATLNNFTHFELRGFYDAGNAYHSFYLPLYLCCGNNDAFEYYYNGKVNIVG
jgi:hypothetical protein